jgi:hypothetical protein
MSGKLHDLYRQVVSRSGVASGGCKPQVKELPLKGSRETPCRPSTVVFQFGSYSLLYRTAEFYPVHV